MNVEAAVSLPTPLTLKGCETECNKLAERIHNTQLTHIPTDSMIMCNPVTSYSEILQMGAFVWSCVSTCLALLNIYLRAETLHFSHQALYHVSTAHTHLKYSLMLVSALQLLQPANRGKQKTNT